MCEGPAEGCLHTGAFTPIPRPRAVCQLSNKVPVNEPARNPKYVGAAEYTHCNRRA
jgi:hypothetical protein